MLCYLCTQEDDCPVQEGTTGYGLATHLGNTERDERCTPVSSDGPSVSEKGYFEEYARSLLLPEPEDAQVEVRWHLARQRFICYH